MKGESVMYCGRLVPTEGFRTFIYGIDGAKKLVESWDEYLNCISLGIWFSTLSEANSLIPTPEDKPKKKRGD